MRWRAARFRSGCTCRHSPRSRFSPPRSDRPGRYAAPLHSGPVRTISRLRQQFLNASTISTCRRFPGNRPTALRRISVTIPINIRQIPHVRFESRRSPGIHPAEDHLKQPFQFVPLHPGGTAEADTAHIRRAPAYSGDRQAQRREEQRLGVAGIHDAVDLSAGPATTSPSEGGTP